MILVLDNYDSFTYNLVHLLYSLHAEVKVFRNREISAKETLAQKPDGILLSPGPGRPSSAGCMPDVIRLITGKIPIFGVCLGHQGIGEAFGAKIIPAKQIMHGKASRIEHNGHGVFQGIRNSFKAVRYHSLALDRETMPDELEITAESEDGEIMGIRHRTLPVEGVQFHPESIMSMNGGQILANFLKTVEEFNRNGGRSC